MLSAIFDGSFKSKRKKFGRESKRIVKEKFDLEKSIKKYKKIYDEI